jgi:hypothetical protein
MNRDELNREPLFNLVLFVDDGTQIYATGGGLLGDWVVGYLGTRRRLQWPRQENEVLLNRGGRLLCNHAYASLYLD